MSARSILVGRETGNPGGFAYVPRRRVKAVHAGSDATGTIVRVSPLGMMVACAGDRWPLGPTDVGVPMVRERIAAHVDSVDDGIASVRFVDLRPEWARDMLEWIHRAVARGEAGAPATRTSIIEHIRDPERIDAILRMFADSSASARVLGSRGSITTVVRARWDPMGELLVAGALPRGRASVETYGPWSVYSFEGNGALPRPSSIMRLRRRHWRRVELRGHVTATIRRLQWPGPPIERRVHDLSIGGLAFEIDPVEDVLFPGSEIEFELKWRGGQPVSGRAIVRHVTQDADIPLGALCGVEAIRTPGFDAWGRVVDEVLHPTTEWGQAAPAELWNVYRESGYFNLSGKAADEFEDLEQDFEATHDLVVRAPHLGARFALRTRRGLEATIAQLEAWEGSWLVFQLGWLPSNRALTPDREHTLYSLYLHAYEHLQIYARPRWLVSLVQDNARWSRRVHLNALQRHVASGRAMTVPFRALELRTAAVDAPSDDYDVGPPRADESACVVSHLARARHPIELAAFGLEDPMRDVEPLIARWAAAGLRRWREVLVARREERVVGFAILDGAQPGLHLFCLTDCARIFRIADDAEGVERALLTAARSSYAARGHSRFVLFDELRDPPAWAADARDLGAAHIGVLAAELIPEFLEHLAEVTTRHDGQDTGRPDR